MHPRAILPALALAGAVCLVGPGLAVAAAAPAPVSSDCTAITDAQAKVTSLQKQYNQAKLKVSQAQTAYSQAQAATPPVLATVEAARAALAKANTTSYNLYGALSTAQIEVTTATRTAADDGVECPGKPGDEPTPQPSGDDGKNPTGGKDGPDGGKNGPDGGKDGQGTERPGESSPVDQSQSQSSAPTANATVVVNPSVQVDPTACDGTEASTSGSEVTDVPTGSAQTGAA